VSGRGWSSANLRIVGDDPTLWTTGDAARLLGPPELSPVQVRELIRVTGLQPVGKRRVTARGQSGRHARVYWASDLIRAYDALYRVVETTTAATP